MQQDISFYKKAYTLEEVDNAVRFDVPIDANHEFYTDFSDVRGEFEEKALYRALNVNHKKLTYNLEPNRYNKTLIFLAGMRGSGKTSELAKIAKKLYHKDGFFPVTCNLDDGLDLNDMEYMDILIFQLERLFEAIEKVNLNVNQSIIGSLQKWFSARIKEANTNIRKEGGFEVAIKAETPSLLSFLGIATKVKANLLGSKDNATKIRTVFKNNFSDFAKKFNEFVEEVNLELRKKNIAKELLFIVDGLEKTASLQIRKKILLEESNRMHQIRVNTIFTLPIELMSEHQKLIAISNVITFPFVKIREKNGDIVEKAVNKFVEFTYRRIDAKLFDSTETVRQAILYGGGSPREYLRVLEYSSIYADEDKGIIDMETLEKAIKKLAAETSQYITDEDLALLKILNEANQIGRPIPYGPKWQSVLEKLIVLEYNDGTYKRVNPIVEASELYQYYVHSK